MSEYKPRYHGWHWWYGISNEEDSEGRRVVIPQWHVVHCWATDGECYALGPHFTYSMLQKKMGGTWGEELIPPKFPL